MKHKLLVLILICSVHLSFAEIIFKKHIIGDNQKSTMCIIPIDIDKDGDNDIITASFNKNGVIWWENTGNQKFKKHIVGNNYGGARTVYASDLDQDGYMDILAAGYKTGKLSWFKNDGKQNFKEHTISDTIPGAHTVSTSDLDGDGDIDVMGSSFTSEKIRSGKLTWYENDGKQNFKEYILEKNVTTCVYGTDINSDGNTDILGVMFQNSQIVWWQNKGNRKFTKHIISKTFPGPHWARAIDLDKDGDIDIIGAGLVNHVSWWENDGKENFIEHKISETFPGASSVYASDMDNDGDIDIISTSEQHHDIRWWENNGKQDFTEHTVSGLFPGASDVFIADVDNDGDMDVLGAGNIENQVSWWENKGIKKINKDKVNTEDEFFTYIRTKGTKNLLDLYNSKKDKIRLRETYLNTLGYEFLSKKKYEEAIAVFKLNSIIYPRSVSVYFTIAEGYFTIKDMKSARKYYNKAKTFKVDDIPITKHLRLSLLLKDKKTYIHLLDDLKKNNATKYKLRGFAITFLGYQLLNQNYKNEAIIVFIAGTELFPESFNAFDSLGEAYMKNGQPELARKNFKKSLELNSKNLNAVEMLKKLK